MATKNTKTAEARKPLSPINYVEFVSFWQSATSTKDVAEKFGRSVDATQQIAYNLRKKGVGLKRFTNSHQRIDYAALVELAKRCEAGEGS